MSAQAATPVDSSQGTIKEPTVTINKASPNGGATYSRHYRRTYCHYISNVGSTPSQVPLQVKAYAKAIPNSAGQTFCNYYYEGAYVVPYHNCAVSTMPRHWITDFMNADKVRIRSFGFKIKSVTVLQEQIVTRAASTSLENTFQGKPHLQMYVDREHLYDRCIGLTTAAGASQPTAEAAHCMWAMRGAQINGATQSVKPWNIAASQPTFVEPNVNNVNNYWLEAYPASQGAGELPHVGLYVLESIPGQTATYPWAAMQPDARYSQSNRHQFIDVLDCHTFGEGDTPGFMWDNANPDWRNIAREDYSFADKDQGAIRLSTTSFPPTRDQAFGFPYRRFWANEVTEKGRNDWTDDHGSAFEYYTRVCGNTHSGSEIFSDNVPPNVFLKVEPLLGPTGPINITAQVYIEYTMTLEFHEGRFGLMVDSYQVGPSTLGYGRPCNQYGIRSMNAMMDPQRYTMGTMSFWNGDLTGTVNNTSTLTGGKKRKSDDVVPYVVQQQPAARRGDGDEEHRPQQQKRMAEPRSDQSD